ncbi:hypothetical protein [Kitasatospora paranensis]|uniref:hypothetical protein n=1 Tax=Kitasatospora paranensis TaxID=258053 RepID=UPI0031ECFC89
MASKIAFSSARPRRRGAPPGRPTAPDPPDLPAASDPPALRGGPSGVWRRTI